MPVRLFVIKPVEERERERAPRGRRRDPRAAGVPARHHVADRAAAPLAPAPPAPFVPGVRRVAAPAPARPRARVPDRARASRARPPHALSGPRKIYVKELLQAIALADRRARRADVGHLHAHFAHGTTTVTWLAAQIAGLPFSFTGHASDIYARELNPPGLLRRKLLRGQLRRHLHRRQRRAPAADRARGARPPRLPRPERRLRAAARRAHAAAGRPTARCACSAWAGWSPRRASTCSSRPARCCAAAASPSRRGSSARTTSTATRVRRADRRATGSRTTSRLPGPMGQDELLGEYRRAERALHALPRARRRPRRHPERAGRGDGGRPAGRGDARSRASPSSSRTRSTGCSSRPRTPRRWPTRCCACTATPALARAAGARRSRHGARALRRRRAGRRARRAVRRQSRVSAPTVPPAPGAVRDRARAPRPRGRRGGRRRPLHVRGRDARRSGTAPDWLGADLPADEEWRIEWVKFYYGLDLAHAVRGPASRASATPGSGSSRSWIRQVPPGHDPQRRRGAPDAELALRVAAVRAATPARGRGWRASIARAGRATSAPTSPPERNHRTLELYALLVAALALPRARPDGTCATRRRRARPQPRDRLPRRRRAPRGARRTTT